jgi:L-methionine (R)-S-oxide reductase
MAESLIIQSTSKAEKYSELLPQIKALITGETNAVANMANVTAALKTTFNFFWVGFYVVENTTLVLAPFQGPIACTRIAFGKGVCGKVWESKQSLIVPNVDLFEGHIACSSDSKSEIVIPIFKGNEVVAVLDVDSDQLNDFDETDEKYLTQLCQWLSEFL